MTVRSVTQGLAPLLQALELEQPRVVTSQQLALLAREEGVEWPVDVVAQRLRQRGWLLPLGTKGVWEFAPASRAGAFGSGDPLIELRAVLARDPDAPYTVAAESAAYRLGLSSRLPDRECIAVPHGARPPKSLSGYRTVTWDAPTAPIMRDDLPVWSLPTLLAFMATRPGSYHDWPNVGEWLSQAVHTTETAALMAELAGHSAAAWVRAAYLLDRGGDLGGAQMILRAGPVGSGPYYLGDRASPGRHYAAYDVVDSSGLEVQQP